MASAKACPECIAPPYGVVCGFFFYVNDLPLELCSETDMYAGDTTLRNKGRNKAVIQSNLQVHVDLLKTQNCVFLSQPNPYIYIQTLFSKV